MKQLRCKLNNWVVTKDCWCMPGPDKYILWGDVDADGNKQWGDGTRIRTSWLVDPRKDFKQGDVVETENSRYLLGTPAEDNCDHFGI